MNFDLTSGKYWFMHYMYISRLGICVVRVRDAYTVSH